MISGTHFARIAAVAVAAFFVGTGASAACGPDALGTSRTVTLKREYAAYGKVQHDLFPLKKGEVILTFDDGPRADNTPVILKGLADECVKATFFMQGNNMLQNPDLARQVVSEGHSAGMHSYAHAHLNSLTPEEQIADLKKTQEAFKATFGVDAPAYRFPFLEETPTLLAALKAEKIALFSVDLGIDDWTPGETTDMLLGRLVERLKVTGGGIILMHDSSALTAASVPVLLKALKDNGYSVVHLQWK